MSQLGEAGLHQGVGAQVEHLEVAVVVACCDDSFAVVVGVPEADCPAVRPHLGLGGGRFQGEHGRVLPGVPELDAAVSRAGQELGRTVAGVESADAVNAVDDLGVSLDAPADLVFFEVEDAKLSAEVSDRESLSTEGRGAESHALDALAFVDLGEPGIR